MKNVYMFCFEDDDLKNNFKLLCLENSMTIQKRIMMLIKEDIERESLKEKTKQKFLNNEISRDEYNKILKNLT
jgi:hypothetical protein